MRSNIKELVSGALTSTIVSLLLGVFNVAEAGVIQIQSGYEVTYDIKLSSKAVPPGMDINSVFIFEWDDSGNRSVDYSFQVAGSGQTVLSHVIDFAPTSAFLLGYIDAVPGAIAGTDDAKRHLYTLTDPGFKSLIFSIYDGLPFSQIFGQGEQYTIDQLILADQGGAGSAAALSGLWSLVDNLPAGAAFDPAGNFYVQKWSIPVRPVPVPATLALFGLGLAGLGWSRRKKA